MIVNRITCFLFTLIVLITLSGPAYTNVGEIGQVEGSAVIERDNTIVIEGKAGVGVESMDTAVTAKGTMRINFIDQTRVELTEQSRLVIDEFVYDPGRDLGTLSLKASLGTIR